VVRRKENVKNKTTEPEPLRGSKIVMDSMRVYLDNISNVLVKSVAHGQHDSASSEQEDETSIQEMITIKDRSNG
jgi:hypothetical protein